MEEEEIKMEEEVGEVEGGMRVGNKEVEKMKMEKEVAEEGKRVGEVGELGEEDEMKMKEEGEKQRVW